MLALEKISPEFKRNGFFYKDLNYIYYSLVLTNLGIERKIFTALSAISSEKTPHF